MKVNANPTRTVKTYAMDLAVGDVVVNRDGIYVGRVKEVPLIHPDGAVSFRMTIENHSDKFISWASTRVVRIEIAREVPNGTRSDVPS